jgi:large subunit ribosomal protein L6
MSRVGKLPIAVPAGVTITVDNDFITVNGPKGSLKQFTMPGIKVNSGDNEVTVARDNDEKQNRAKHGLMRALLNNMVQGVAQGLESVTELLSKELI